MTYDPLKKKEFPDAVVRVHFGKGSNAAKANRLAKDNPELFHRMRAQAVEDNLVPAQNGYQQPGWRIGVMHPKEPDPQYDSATMLAMGEFPKDFCVRLIQGRLNQDDINKFNQWVPMDPNDQDKVPSYAKLEKKAPEIFERARKAAVAHGVLCDGPRHTPANQTEPKPVDDGRVPLGDQLGAVVGLPGSYRVTSEEYVDVLNFANAQAAAKAK